MKKLWLLFCPTKWQLSPQWPAPGWPHLELTRYGITSANRVVTKINTKPISKTLCWGETDPSPAFIYWIALKGKKQTFSDPHTLCSRHLKKRSRLIIACVGLSLNLGSHEPASLFCSPFAILMALTKDLSAEESLFVCLLSPRAIDSILTNSRGKHMYTC